MDLKNLCTEIGLSAAMTRRILDAEAEVLPIAQGQAGQDLLCPERWGEGLKEASEQFGQDPDGVKMLTCMLLCCDRTWEIFREKGLSREIFRDTLGCFPRFVAEHVESFGYEAFDRAFWTVRQISGRLFRIGALEYELLPWEGNYQISVHIPSDADLSTASLRDSYDRAREILNRIFPEFTNSPMTCASWLLSPQLADFLPENSRILGFQRNFTVDATHESDDIRLWVFKNPKLSNQELPENTSLQKKLKAFLLSGGAFSNGQGVLREPAFREV